jgi:H+/gluconate symporter-like permease
MKQLKAQHIGLITGAIMIVALLFSFYIAKLPVESNFQFVVYGVFCAGIVWSLFNSFLNEPGKISFKDFFSVGFKTFVIVALLMAVYTYIFFSIHTDFRDAKIAQNNQLILKEGHHLPNEIEQNSNQLKKLFLPIMVSSAVFRYLIVGALVSAVGAGFLSSRRSKETSNR